MDMQKAELPIQVQTLNVELLGKPIHIIRNKLEDLLTGSCQTLSLELQSWLKTQHVTVTLQEVTLTELPVSDMQASSTSVLKHNESGMLYVAMVPAMLMRLSDQFYGADIERSSDELTNSDLRLLHRMAKCTSTWVAPSSAWQLHDFEMTTGVGIAATLVIDVNGQQALLKLTLDSALIQTLIDELELDANPHIASDFCYALQKTPVRLNVQLSKTVLPLTQVLELKPNDILPIELLTQAPVHIGKERLFTGRVAEQEGQLVLIINDDKDTNR
ncbi:FliM/FliN family flagellar motor switch protein [Vibrio parahaemolyticus]|uniref:FliM/FliN family flagellar motor switch protein n=1 Tax=Vibrio mediterranei TaxID=689 RepID=UPI00406890E0